MRHLIATFAVTLALLPQATPSWAESLAVPAVAFRGDRVGYNVTGTAAFLRERAFAPVALPDGARALGFTCGAQVRRLPEGVRITLRRNAPQQANVDMGSVEIPRGSDTSFKFLTTRALEEPVIDNDRFNYYLVAEVLPQSETVSSLCSPLPEGGTECLVGACTVRFSMEN